MSENLARLFKLSDPKLNVFSTRFKKRNSLSSTKIPSFRTKADFDKHINRMNSPLDHKIIMEIIKDLY